ncbi:MAG: hypothetical protein Q9224_006178, partial [Gallowayella concinna]
MRGSLSRRFNLVGEEEELMHGFESLLKIALNLGAQMLSALITLPVTVDDGHEYNSTYLRAGQAAVSQIDCYYHGNDCLKLKDSVTMHALAHVYGDMKTLSADQGDYDDIADLAKSKQDFSVWGRRDRKEFAHRFNEYNRNDTRRIYPYLTNRIISSASGERTEYDVDEKPDSAIMGGVKASKFTYRKASFQKTILIPLSSLGPGGTTYIYRGLLDPSKATSPDVVCGDRCMYMWVFRNGGKAGGPRLYQCPITVSHVSNSKLPEHNVPDSVARVAAVSIALQGRFQGPRDGVDFHQYQFYARG